MTTETELPRVLYETKDFMIVEANSIEHAAVSAEICSLEFLDCPFFGGLCISQEEILKIAFEAACYSLNDRLLLIAINKENNKVVTTSVSLSYIGKHNFEKRLRELKLNCNIDMFCDLTAQVELVEKEGPESVYMFLFATLSTYRNMKLGSCIVNVVLKDLQSKRYKIAYGETVNGKAEYIIKKNGAKLHKSINYEDYELEGKKLKIIKKGEKQTAFEYDLNQFY